MPSSFTASIHELKFAWVQVPPPVAKKSYWGDQAWHERRRAAHTSSFMALELLINQIGETEITDRFLQHFLRPQAALELAERHYHVLDKSQQICSRSHTDNWACAVLGALGPQNASVGVDIEARQRVVKPGIRRFYEHDDDQTEGLQPLEIWCLKEAAFKAVSSYLNFRQLPSPELVLTDICLQASSDQVSFFFRKYKGLCALLPENAGPKGLYTAWALLRI